MPFDPASIIGYISTAAGLISFLANTVSRLEKIKRDYSESARLLRWYGEKFGTCHHVLYLWHSKYGGHTRPWTDKQFEDIWGAEDFATIRSKLHDITMEINYIVTLLYSGSGLDLVPSSDNLQQPNLKDWRVWATRLQDLKSNKKAAELSVRKKIIHAIYKNANLEERTKRLDDQVSDLEKFSQLAFWKYQMLDTQTPVTAMQLEELADRIKWYENISDDFTKLYENDQGYTWSLILVHPSTLKDRGRHLVEKQAGFVAKFDVIQEHQDPGKVTYLKSFRVLSIRSRDAGRLSSFDELPLGSTVITSPLRISKPFRDLETGDISSAREETTALRLFQATTALSLVHWSTLLWRTPWTFGVCMCRCKMRIVEYGKTELHDMTVTTMPSNIILESCHSSALSDRRALLLAICLAEIALMKRINIRLSEKSTTIFIIEDAYLQEHDLLKRVAASARPEYQNLIRFCLLFDERLLLERHVTLRPNDILKFEERVMDLLFEEQTEAREEHAKWGLIK